MIGPAEDVCAARERDGRLGTRRIHRWGQTHLCVEPVEHPGWHHCWCGYQWGALPPETPFHVLPE